ncbi:hypothetical protein V3C99_017649 [Haemonchus contortus]
MGTEGKIKVDEHYPSEIDEPPLYHIKKIESIRSNVKFEQCYESSELIGDGKFGRVYAVREKASGNEFAAKVIRLKQQADRQEVEREVSILTQLRHPRIAQIYDAFYTPNNEVVLIMEIVRGGELFDRVADESYVLTEMAVVMIICQLCEAIDYIHEMNILHLDIKPENIMCVSQTGNRIKLIDFGLARYYDGTQELRYMAGTPEFAAPEVIKYEQLDYHTDMWSVGVITYILLSGYSPFLGENICETYCNVEKGVWDFTEEFDLVSPEAKDFISRLIVYKKEKRMLPKECLAHPWIARHRAKVSCDAILEKPAEGPVMDNKQIMRYNAQRKLRLFYFYMRVIIYVRFLMEMNRLRSMVKNRMSDNAKKYFEPLLKVADDKETSQPASTAGTSKILSTLAQVKAKSAEKSDVVEEVSASEGTSNNRKETTSTKKKQTSNPIDSSTASVSDQKLAVTPVPGLMKSASEVKLSKRLKSEKKVSKEEKDIPKTTLKKSSSAETPKEPLAATSSAKESDTTTIIPSTGSIRSRSKTPEKKQLDGKASPLPQVIVTAESPAPIRKEQETAPETKSTAAIRKRSKTPEKRSKNEATEVKEAEPTSKVKSNVKKLAAVEVPESLPTKATTAGKTVPENEEVERKSLYEKNLTPTDMNAAKPPRPASPVDSAEKASLKKRKSASPGRQKILGTASSLDETLIGPKSKEDTSRASSSDRATANQSPVKSGELESSSLKLRKASAPEAIITPPPKKTVLGAPQNTPNDVDKTTPIRIQRFGSSESGDSTKENRNMEEKKPTRQGAMRKKEKPADDLGVISQLPPSTSPANPPAQQPMSSISTLLRKRQSINEVKPEPQKENGVTPRPGSVQDRLQKLRGRVTSPIVTLGVVATTPSSIEKKESPNSEEPRKRGKLLPITTESKTVTTTTTSTSTKSRKANVEKKVQHVSDGKSVEEVERTSTEQDKVSITEITMRKAETLEKPGTTTSVKKNVVKQDSLRSTAEKERVEEQNKDAAKTLRTARSALSKTTEKVTVEESSKVDGKPNKLSMAGTTDVTRKVVEKSEVKADPLGKPVKETQLTASEKVKTALDVEKNAKKGSVEKLTTTKVTVKTSDPSADVKDTVKTASKTGLKSSSSKTSDPPSEAEEKAKSAKQDVSGVKSTASKTHDTSSELKDKMKNGTKLAVDKQSEVARSSSAKATLGREPRKDTSKSPSRSPSKRVEGEAKATSVTKVSVVNSSKAEDGTMKPKKKRATIIDGPAVEFVPKEDFSFDALKEKLVRRVSYGHQEDKPKKEVISIPTISSVRDRLRKFEGKT